MISVKYLGIPIFLILYGEYSVLNHLQHFSILRLNSSKVFAWEVPRIAPVIVRVAFY